MKRNKRYLLLFALALIPFHSSINGCGWWYSEDEVYYNLFDQLLLQEKGLRPFLLTGEPGFFKTETELPDENINAWMTFIGSDRKLRNLDKSAISELVYRTPLKELNTGNAISGTTCAIMSNSNIGKQVINYLRYAKTLEPYAQENTETWEQSRVQPPASDEYQKLLEEGIKLWKSSDCKELKLRYGYQLVRLAHYSDNNEEALELFNEYVEPVKQNHVIYYYALEQKGGVLYNLNRNAEANYLFCQVFDHSDNRKEIAYNSIKIQGEVDWNKTYGLCKTNREKAVLYAVRGYNTFSDETEEMRNILQVCPESPYLRLLAIRYINKLERSILNIFYDAEYTHSFMAVSQEIKKSYESDKELINSIIGNRQVGEKDFWSAYLAHMAFLCKDYKLCENTLDEIKTSNPELLKQVSRTRFCLYLTTLKRLGKEEEKDINEYLAKENIDKEFVREIVAHLYKQQGEYGKAYLVHNKIVSLEQNPDIVVINSLIKEYETNGNFSACISLDSINNTDMVTLYELKGTHYLRMGIIDESIKWYDKVPDDYTCFTHKYDYDNNEDTFLSATEYNGYSGISPLIFSNGFKRWFNIPAEKELTDVIYRQKEFSFLNKYHNKKTLAQSLLRLKEMAEKMDETGMRAAYLLANYYFNISSDGYYRNIPFYFCDNGYSSSHYRSSVINKFHDFSNEYNYKDFSSYVLLTNDAFKALHIYEDVARYSSDRELVARALFMAAACVRDLYSQNEEDKPKADRYYSKIARMYSDTNFFKEAKNECKYFDYYIKNEF